MLHVVVTLKVKIGGDGVQCLGGLGTGNSGLGKILGHTMGLKSIIQSIDTVSDPLVCSPSVDTQSNDSIHAILLSGALVVPGYSWSTASALASPTVCNGLNELILYLSKCSSDEGSSSLVHTGDFNLGVHSNKSLFGLFCVWPVRPVDCL